MSARRIRAVVLLAATALLPTLLLSPSQADDGFAAAKRVYEERRRRPSFYKRTEGRRVLAATDDDRAIGILAGDHASPESPKEEVRHSIVATVFQRRWSTDEARQAIRAWREASTKAHDAWLWYRSLLAELRRIEDEHALAAWQDAKLDPHLREAAIRALADGRYTEIFTLLKARLAGLEDKRFLWAGRQAAVLESVAVCLASLKIRHERDAWKETAKALLSRLDAQGLPRRTKFVVTRAMAHVLGGDPTLLDSELWIREVLAGGSGAGAEDRRYDGPSFGGLRATGERIVYVIDLSDSMMAPLDDEVKKRLRAVVTGPLDPEDGTRRDLPWHAIDTRFDLAREMLKASLLDLDKEKRFAVVGFGDTARALDSTPKLRKATSSNVERAIREIDAIEAGPPGTGSTTSPHGALWGETNLHGGLRLAFRMTTKGVQRGEAFVDAAMRDIGAETIFLLSDGEPTFDDWVEVDKRDTEGAVMDRETLAPTANTATLRFPGPYGFNWGPYLVDDIARRNFFRHVEIHCVGIGDAQMDLLHRLAAVGLGKATQLGEE